MHNPRRQKVDGWAVGRELGVEGMRRNCFIGTGFLFGGMKMFWSWLEVAVA